MSRGLVLGLIILAVLAASLWFLVKDDGGGKLIEDVQKGVGTYVKSQTPMPNVQASPKAQSPRAIPAEFQSGNSRFSRGACASDADCKTGGCSGEVCSSGGGEISTCEFSDSFPNAKKYSCGCINLKCGWR